MAHAPELQQPLWKVFDVVSYGARLTCSVRWNDPSSIDAASLDEGNFSTKDSNACVDNLGDGSDPNGLPEAADDGEIGIVKEATQGRKRARDFQSADETAAAKRKKDASNASEIYNFDAAVGWKLGKIKSLLSAKDIVNQFVSNLTSQKRVIIHFPFVQMWVVRLLSGTGSGSPIFCFAIFI